MQAISGRRCWARRAIRIGLLHIASYVALGGGFFLLQWPTLSTLVMFPILVFMYARLARSEQTEMHAQFGDDYERCARLTPRFFPSLTSRAIARDSRLIAAPIYGRHEETTAALAAAPAAAFALPDDHRRLSSHMESSSMMMAGERESAMRMRALAMGAAASAVLFALYFLLVGLVSGARYAVEQFATYWYFLVALAVGFGIQMGLYTYLKNLVAHSAASRKVVAVSGTTSTAAMVSCCAHYLANIVPVLGVTGLVTFAIQYQVELFWAGLAFNLAGVAYILRKVMQANKEHAQCATPA